MEMAVRLIGWRYKNIRGGLHGLEISLGNPPSRWSLIQMPNGMGKTTTMLLLRAALSGAKLDEDAVRDFRPSDTVKSGEFELIISISGQTYRITVSLNYESGLVTYHTARTESGGKQTGHVLPPELKSLLTPEFTKLFVFDGELARQIRDLHKQRASEAIRSLYRLDTLTFLRSDIDRIVSEEQQKASATTKAQTNQGLKALKTRLETKKEKLAELKRKQRTIDTDLSEKRSKISELERAVLEHMQQDKDFRARANKLEQERIDIDKRLVEVAKTTLSELRNPAMIHSTVIHSLSELGQKMQRLKLPKTMSLEFFYELAEQSECVCGRPISPTEKEAIRKRAKDYLSEDQIGVVNAIKSAVRQYENQKTTFSERATELNSLIREKHRLNGDWARLEAERVEAGDHELQVIRDQKNQLEQTILDLEENLEALTCTDIALQRKHNVDDKSNIPLCKALKDKLEAAHAEATGTVQFQEKANATKALVELIENSALGLIKERLQEATNKKLKTFIRGENIRVSRIGGALELESDHLGSKQQVSEGQSLAIAYAFLTSLFEEAPYRLPFIVDSPAGSLDLKVRREVAELIPNLFDQMVMFVISSEREGFAEPFFEKKDVQFQTIWRDEAGITRSKDDLAFFKQFHSDENEKTPKAGA